MIIHFNLQSCSENELERMQSEMNAEGALNVFSKIGSFGSTSRGSLGNPSSEYKGKKGEKRKKYCRKGCEGMDRGG